MRTIQSWFAVAAVIAAYVFTVSKPVYADTFDVFQLTTANGTNVYGIDTAGVVVIQAPSPVPGPPNPVYETWVLGVHLSDSFTPPNLNYDNGLTCIPTVSAGISVSSVAKCNDGHEVYGAYYGPPQPNQPRGIFTGPNLSDLLTIPFPNSGLPDGIDLNASGDFVWVDGGVEEIFEAIDLNVPEPGSIVFLATGVLTLLGGIRRQVIRASRLS